MFINPYKNPFLSYTIYKINIEKTTNYRKVLYEIFEKILK